MKDGIWKRLAITACLTLVVTTAAVLCSPKEAHADLGDTFVENGINYEVTKEDAEGNEVKVIRNNPKYAGAISIPATVTSNNTNYSVTAVDSDAFRGCVELTTVSFEGESKLATIGNSAFYECGKLGSISIPAGVTSIGSGAFRGCVELTTVSFEGESKLATIGNSAFYKCGKLGSISIPASVTSIGNYAFYECGKLTSISIPSGVTSIGTDAFLDTGNLTDIALAVNGEVALESGATGFKKGTDTVTLPNGKAINRVVIEPGGKITNNSGGAIDAVMGNVSFTLPSGATILFIDTNSNVITVVIAGQSFVQGDQVSFSVTGAGMDNAAPEVGSVRFVPVSWSVNPSGTFLGTGPFTASFSTANMSAGGHTLTISYNMQWYNGGAWAPVPGASSTAWAAINVTEKAVVPTPEPTPTPTPTPKPEPKPEPTPMPDPNPDPNPVPEPTPQPSLKPASQPETVVQEQATEGVSPKTGDSARALVYLVIGGIALGGMVAGMYGRRKKRS